MTVQSLKFIYIDHDKILNHRIHMENRVTDVLKNLIKLYKVLKIVTDGLPSFRPNLSAIGTPTYKLAKFLVPMLEPLTTNEYTIKDSFTFAEKLQSFDSKLVMVSFDIVTLY